MQNTLSMSRYCVLQMLEITHFAIMKQSIRQPSICSQTEAHARRMNSFAGPLPYCLPLPIVNRRLGEKDNRRKTTLSQPRSSPNKHMKVPREAQQTLSTSADAVRARQTDDISGRQPP